MAEKKKILLSQLKVNSKNPRSITERKMNLLVERLLAFPKMIELRPIVVDKSKIALGGNMRLRAFNIISEKSIEDIVQILSKTKNYQRMTKIEQENLKSAWEKWLKKPEVPIVEASELSEEEKKEFIIADNASFGDWDYDALANEWDNNDLNSWGIDVWSPEPTPQRSEEHSAAETEQQEIPSFDCSNLPSELQGCDMTPNVLPKIEGDDEVAMERIIIVYPKDKENALAKVLGLSHFDKVIYNFDEIITEE